MEDELVTLATFAGTEEAEFVRGLLESHGLRAFVAGDRLVGMMWHLGNAVGGVRVLVPARDAAEASTLLRELRSEAEAEATGEAATGLGHDAGEDSGDDDSGPNDDERRVERAWKAAIIGIFVLPPLLHLYSFYLLVTRGDAELTPAAKRRFFGALAVDAAMFVAVASVWISFS